MPKHMLMSDIEIITDGGRRRRWTAADKLRIVEGTLEDCASLSVVARRNGVALNLLYRWRRLMFEGGSIAVSEDDSVTSNCVVSHLEERIRAIEHHLGRNTLEAQTQREALERSRVINRHCYPGSREREISGEDGGRNSWGRA